MSRSGVTASNFSTALSTVPEIGAVAHKHDLAPRVLEGPHQHVSEGSIVVCQKQADAPLCPRVPCAGQNRRTVWPLQLRRV